ncbi:protein ULTRAPETALA 2-like [Bidens hawaiensis]|uniref:protein ULTRAPETALA 2-like n=1 Tax=Bidens hawaiensis TaxID=980011 RepID=UPI004049A93C
MAQGIKTIFSNEELSAFDGQIRVRAPHYIEIECGCTSRRHGDSVGILRISDDGTICATLFNSPEKFAKHASNSNSMPNWRTKIWVQNFDGERIKLGKTCLLRYYKGDEYVRPDSQFSHRDEFLHCSVCNKVRRFTLRTSDAFEYYHRAVTMENRTCKDMILGGHVKILRREAQDPIVDALRKQTAKVASIVFVLDAKFAGLTAANSVSVQISMQIHLINEASIFNVFLALSI